MQANFKFLGIKSFRITEEEFASYRWQMPRFPFVQAVCIIFGLQVVKRKPYGIYISVHTKTIKSHRGFLVTNKDLSRSRWIKSISFLWFGVITVTASNGLTGKGFFTRLFEKNKSSKIFKFLDNESSFTEEISLISTLQKAAFFKAAYTYISLILVQLCQIIPNAESKTQLRLSAFARLYWPKL